MIKAKFFQKNGMFTGFSVSGHAGYGEYGHDIVCAAVTSAVMLTVNGITEVLSVAATVTQADSCITLHLPEAFPAPDAPYFIQSLYVHLQALAADYTEYLEVLLREQYEENGSC